MRTLLSAVIVLTTLAMTGCGSTGADGNSNSNSAGGNGNGNGGAAVAQGAQAQNAVTPTWDIPGPPPRNPAAAQPRPAQARSNPSRSKSSQSNTAKANTAKANNAPAAPLPKNPDVPVLKLDDSEVPAAVRAIEKVIDKRSALLADTVRIEISKNYEWDVSLSGNGVTPHRPEQGGTVAEATGNPRAYFRNLDIRARDKIVLWRSGLNVTPFIRVYAKGAVSYIDTDDATGKPRVQRAGNCRINNSSIAFDQQILGVPGMDASGAQPAALREKGN
jgi:hypothetical protein